MPYIPVHERAHFARNLKQISEAITSPGELTYCLYVLLLGYHASNYAEHSQVIAAATDAAHEYRRRMLDPYEDRKRAENGDVHNA